MEVTMKAKHRTKRIQTKATTQPTTRTAISVPVIAAPERTNLTTLSRDAPAITGMARKKVNSATQARDKPSSRPPTMVAPEATRKCNLERYCF